MEQDDLQGRRPPLPPDVENCHRVIWELFDALLASRTREEQAEAEKAEIIRRFFGPRRERFVDDPAQGKLFETGGPAETGTEAAEATSPPVVEEERPTAPPKKGRHGRRRFPAHFPRIRREYKLSDAERLCPCCGKLRKVIGEEISEQLDYVPGHHQVIIPGEAKTKTGYFWAYCGDKEHPCSVYDFTLSHCRDGPARWLQGYHGYLQADAYNGYDGIAIQSEGRLILVGCGAHLRRRFFAHPEHRLEINRSIGTPVGLEAALSGADV
jgi:hypothetical protein